MRAFVAIGIALAFAMPATSQTSVEVEVITKTIHVNSAFNLRLTINGKYDEIEFPESSDIEIRRRPVSQEQRINMQPGRVSALFDFVLLAIPRREGELTLGAFTVRAGDEVVKSQPVSIAVLPPNAPPSQSAQAPEEESGELMRDDWDQFVWLESNVDKAEVYVGEAVTLTSTRWEVQAQRLRIIPAGPTAYTPQSTNGFYAVEIPQRQEMDRYRTYPYRKEIFQQILYPTTSGSLTIGPWQWRGRAAHLSNFGSLRPGESYNYLLETAPIPVEVKPLPPAPPEFSGAVGEFTMNAALEPASVVVGQPARLTVTIAGEGNPEIIGAPSIPEIEAAFVSGPEAHVLDLTPNDVKTVEKAFVWQIVPKEAQNIDFPSVEFVYFNPNADDYAALTSEEMKLGVVSAPEGLERVMADSGGARGGEATSVDVYEDALAPIVKSPGAIYASRAWTTPFVAALASPAAAYAIFIAWLLHYRRNNSDSPEARARNAYGRGKKRLADLEGHATDIDALHQALRGYIADRLGVPEGGLTSHDAERLLHEASIEGDLADATVRTLRACERAAYASQAISVDEHKALLNSAVTNMDRLERAFKEAPQS